MSEFDSTITDDDIASAIADTPDVVQPDTATDEPATPSETVAVAPEAAPEVTEELEPEKEPEKADEPELTSDDLKATDVQDDSRLNWDSAPEAFRANREELVQKLKDAEANSLKDKFLTDSDGFLNELSGLSTSQFQQTTQNIVKRGIEAAPEPFAEYIAEVAPDAAVKAVAKASPDVLAKALFGEGMSAQKAQKIIAQVKAQDLESYLDDSEPVIEQPKVAETKGMSPEEIEKLVEQRVKEAGKPQLVKDLEQKTYAEIMKPVEALIDQANLRPSKDDTPEEAKFKEWASQRVVKDTFEYLMDDEKNAPRAKKMLEFISNLDESGVKHLSGTAAILAEEHAGQLIEMLTSQRAKAKSKPTEAKKAPPKVVPSAGAVPAFGNTPATIGSITDISDADFERAGM